MKFIDKTYTKTYEIKQSKFIAYLTPYDDFLLTLNKLKQEHLKARHFVIAYRYLNEFNQITEYSTDDGEPKGTSGKPSLMVLQGSNLINSAVIIVRYFGGTKLGTGGLVRAYSEAVNMLINIANLSEYKKEIEVKLCFSYSNIRKLEYECEILNICIIKKIFESQAVYTIKADEVSIKNLLKKLDRIIDIIE
ncbi:YigZ family protein [Sulfurimonas sp.]|uniref:YigZ family protein n=1 Tax=Sulfurimonas sp. TaxID=2022749 RepID=UPI002B497473|nr:YigZ family protein [Sulfurimonas sp.]